MAAEPQILYLEPDDEITSVIRRLRQAGASRVVLVAAGRTKATSSALALRLLAGVAADEGRDLALVADPLGRALAAEAGIAAFASVAEASVGGVPAVQAAPAHRAAIHVVRSAEAVAPAPASSMATDETRAVPVMRRAAVVRPTTVPRDRTRAGSRAARRPWVPLALLAALLLAGGAAAAVLPAATIHITPRAKAVGPAHYDLTPPVQHVKGTIPLTMSGKATGEHTELVAAKGSVTFSNWNTVPVEVPKGSQVAAGEIVFVTAQRIVVPSGQLTPSGTIQAGQGSVGVAGLNAGTTGNVPAKAIDTVVDRRLRGSLRGFPNAKLRLVVNPQATTGGAANHQPEVAQADVDALVKQLGDGLRVQLATELATHSDLVIVTPSPAEAPTITIPDGLLGTLGKQSFGLTGNLAYDRLAVRSADVESAARDRLLADPAQAPSGTTILRDTIEVAIGKVGTAGDGVSVAVTVSAEAVPTVDEAAIRRRVAGRTPSEVRAALDDLGAVDVALWPVWAGRVPGMDWRVSIEVTGAQRVARPSGSP